MVESAFGILANKWAIFHRPLDVTSQFCDCAVKASCIPNNFVRLNDRFQMDGSLTAISKVFKLQGREETPKEST